MPSGQEIPLQHLRTAFPGASFGAEIEGSGIVVDSARYSEVLRRLSSPAYVERCEAEWRLDADFDQTLQRAEHVSWLRLVPSEGASATDSAAAGEALAKRVAAVLAEAAPEARLSAFAVPEGDIETVFIFRAADKRDALAALAADESIAPADFLCFGDSENDVGMLNWAGQSVCPANGQPAAKLAASRVSAFSNEDDFIADALTKALGEAFFISNAFPTTIRVKIIGVNEGDFAGDMLKVCLEVTGQREADVKMTWRDKGKYRALTIELHFRDQEMLRAVYAAINRDARVKFKL